MGASGKVTATDVRVLKPRLGRLPAATMQIASVPAPTGGKMAFKPVVTKAATPSPAVVKQGAPQKHVKIAATSAVSSHPVESAQVIASPPYGTSSQRRRSV